MEIAYVREWGCGGYFFFKKSNTGAFFVRKLPLCHSLPATRSSLILFIRRDVGAGRGGSTAVEKMASSKKYNL